MIVLREPTPEQEEQLLADESDSVMDQAGQGIEDDAPHSPAVAEAAYEEPEAEPGEENKSTVVAAPFDPTEPPTHEQQIAVALADVAGAAVEWAKAQGAAKATKKEFDNAVTYLREMIERGPEVYPLFPDTKTSDQETVEYDPPLEHGQVRIRIIEMANVSSLDPEDQDEVPKSDSVILGHRDIYGVLCWCDSGGGLCYFVEEDRYEVLEDWPEDSDGPELHVPPLQFGPAEAVADPDAWRAVPVTDALPLPAGKMALLCEGAATMGELEDFRAAIALGKAKWPKGIGPGWITKIEEMILNWLRDNQQQEAT